MTLDIDDTNSFILLMLHEQAAKWKSKQQSSHFDQSLSLSLFVTVQ